ncbi:MAG TPA: S8 family serine peptidase [Candidatus Nanopelagicales bacterium]|nr:S8 family serine peptidase [Candidatus Nanopelagicales bacterium]
MTAAVLLAPMLTVAAATTSSADDAHGYTARAVQPSSTVSGSKAPTSRLAKTDPKLLGRSSTKLIPVVVKLDYDATATYAGGVRGLTATSPSVTGRALSGSGAEQRYQAYQISMERTFKGELAKAVPAAKVGESLRTVYGGMALQIPANAVATVLGLDGVVAVQRDKMRKMLTDASPSFIGADTLNRQLGGAKNAGKGIIFGSLDSGAWPEHPSFRDRGNLRPPPPKADGTARTCDFGPNPLAAPGSPDYACNNKLIGGAPFIDTYNDVQGGELYPDSARDSDGHGTHTATTTAGDVVKHAALLGVDRGPIRGVAPGAWVSVYKVCGKDGCFTSDTTAAVGQAVLDGVNVINFSISGGGNPFTDPTELAFLDAYAAGVFVAASAGNSGPGAATTDHVSPWVTTVAASTQSREFVSTLKLSSGGNTFTVKGASVTQGVTSPTEVVSAADAPYSHPLCDADVTDPSQFAGKIVLCERGTNARVDKGYKMYQAGAAGMILYNPTLADVETDNHWLPAVHIADGTDMVAWLADQTGEVTGTFTAGVKKFGKGDVMASFSSRGPGGLGIKPDITAPGVEILAGQTPTPDSTDVGPPGQYYQAIAGTSMSSPHIAGSAILLSAVHPSWSPAQLKSALMSTAKTSVLKEDEKTKADPFDYGSGRVDLTKAPEASLTFDESAENMYLLGADPVHAIDLNLASIDAPVMPGEVTTSRTVTNSSSRTQTYRVNVKSPNGSTIKVTPRVFRLTKGHSQELQVRIRSHADPKQYFGMIRLNPDRRGVPTQHVPVAFVPQQGGVTLSSSCVPTRIQRTQKSNCTVTAQNLTSQDTSAVLTTKTSDNLLVKRVDGATRTGRHGVFKAATLTGASAGVPSIAPADDTPAGYIPLSDFGIDPEAVGDEDMNNYDVPSFVYAGETYSSIGVDSNGYLVAGGGSSQDNACCDPDVVIPSPARPNNVLAPYWTDLDGTGAPGISVGVLSDGANSWVVVQWDVNIWGTSSTQTFQVWLGANGDEDISFTYDPNQLPPVPADQTLVVGAENADGSGGDTLGANVAPTSDLRVISSDPIPGAAVEYTVTVKGKKLGKGMVDSTVVSPIVPGTTQARSKIVVS